MSAFNFKTVVVKGDGIRKEGSLWAETADIIPGMFVVAFGQNLMYVKAAEAGSFARRIAEEAEVWGTGIDEPYDTVGERVLYRACHSGMECFAFLAAGQTIAAGDPLEVAADGVLTPQNAQAAVAYAMEAIDNTAGADPVRILVEIM